MRHHKIVIAVILGGILALSSPATANVELHVDVAAPFTEEDLQKAIRLRHAADGSDAAVRVAMIDDQRFVVSVNGRSQLVELVSSDRAASTRVVALVVVSLIVDDRPPNELPPDDEVPPLAAVATEEAPAPSRLSLRVSGLMTRDDNGYGVPMLGASGVYALSPHTYLVASAAIGRNDAYLNTSSIIMPLRLGLEGRAGAAGIELGGQLLTFRESSCGVAEWGAARSVYGAAKVYLPVGNKKLVGELGGYLVLADGITVCNSASNYTYYGGWVGIGVEWPS